MCYEAEYKGWKVLQNKIYTLVLGNQTFAVSQIPTFKIVNSNNGGPKLSIYLYDKEIPNHYTNVIKNNLKRLVAGDIIIKDEIDRFNTVINSIVCGPDDQTNGASPYASAFTNKLSEDIQFYENMYIFLNL
jgi:hypothetical protein